MKKSSFYIIGKHAVIGALRNPLRKVLRVFLTEDSKNKINRENQSLNLLKNIKIYYKTLLKFGGGGKIRTFEDRSQRVYSPPHLTALVPLLKHC